MNALRTTQFQAMDAIEDGNRLPPPPGCPKAMYKLMMKCWYVKYVCQKVSNHM